LFQVGPTGLANDQVPLQANVAGRHLRILQALDHGHNGVATNRAAGLVNRGERNPQQAGITDIIDSDDTNVIGNSYSEIVQGVHQHRRGQVIRADYRIHVHVIDQSSDDGFIRRVPFAN